MRLKFLSLRHISDEAKASAERFPEVLLASLLCGVLSWMALEKWITDELLLIRLMSTLSLGIPLTFAVANMAEGSARPRGVARLITLAVSFGLMLVHYGSFHLQTPEHFFYRFFQFNLAAHLLVAFLPYTRKAEGAGFWSYNEALFQRFVASVFFSAVLYFGLVVAMLAAHSLLNFDFKSNTYFRLAIGVAFVFNTWFFLSDIPRPLPRQPATSYPHNLKILTQYFLIPLVTLYFLILYAYMVKIGLAQEWPKGTVGYLVTAFSVLGIFTLLLIHPLAEDTGDTKWVRIYTRVFYLALFPLVALLLLATWRRVSEYGITEKRYLLSAVGVWFAVVAAYFTAGRRDIRFIPISLFAFVLLTAVGPWSAYSVSYRDQLARLTADLVRVGALVDGKIARVKDPVDLETRRNISSRLDYLNEMHNAAGIQPWFPTVFEKEVKEPNKKRRGLFDSRSNRTIHMMHEMGLTYVNRWEKRETKDFYFHRSYSGYDSNTVLPTRHYAYVVELNLNNHDKGKTIVWDDKKDPANKVEVFLLSYPPEVEIKVGGVGQRFPLAELVTRLKTSAETNRTREEMTLEWNHPKVKLLMYLSSLQGNTNDATPRVTYLSGTLLLSPK